MTETIALHDVDCVRFNPDRSADLVMKDGRKFPLEGGLDKPWKGVCGVMWVIHKLHFRDVDQKGCVFRFERGDGFGRFLAKGLKPGVPYGDQSKAVMHVDKCRDYKRLLWDIVG